MKNEVIYFVRVLEFHRVTVIRPSFALQPTVAYHFVYCAFIEIWRCDNLITKLFLYFLT